VPNVKEHAAHVVVVDRQAETQELIGRCLTDHGYHVSSAAGPAGLSDLLDRNPPDLIVMDMQTMQSADDGWLRRNLAASRDKPVIMLTADVDDAGHEGDLASAADDFLAKPLDPTELLSRISAALDRIRERPQHHHPHGRARCFDRWMLLDGQRKLRATDGSEVKLSRSELALLEAFLEHPGQIVTREQLLELTAGSDADVYDRCIDTQVRRLRKKIEVDPANPRIILTHWRRGYRFAAKVGRAAQDSLVDRPDHANHVGAS
jgi:two-component system, OmpR family, response regulator